MEQTFWSYVIKRKNFSDGIKFVNCHHKNECVEYINKNIWEFSYPKEGKFGVIYLFFLAHTDLRGAMRAAIFGAKYYILTFVANFFRLTMIYLLSQKSDVLPKFKEFIVYSKNKFGRI